MPAAPGSFRGAQEAGYKYTEPGGLEKTAQETMGNQLSGGTGDNPRNNRLPRGAMLVLAVAAIWYFWPKIKRAF